MTAPAERPTASARPTATGTPAGAGRWRPASPVSAVRGLYAIIGFAVAVVAAATMRSEATPVYVAYFVLAFAFEFVWLGSRFPFALPYYTAMNAFAYIAGPAVVTLEYLQRLLSYPILDWLARRGWMSLPPPLAPVLGPQSEGPEARLQAWVDHGTAGTIGAFSVLLRCGLFALLGSFDVGLVPAIAITEYGTLAVLGVLHAFVPLPMAEEMRLGGRWRWRLDDERVDLIVVVVFVAPLFVFVINFAYAIEGLAGAVGFSIATLGPHVLMKLSNDRLSRVSALLESKQRELKDLVHTVAHDLKSPISSAMLTTDLVLERSPDLDAEAREDLGRAVRLLGRAEDMVRDLLRVFRIVWEPERWCEVSLDRTLARVLEAVEPLASSRGATVAVSPLPVVWGQPSKLEHAFANLVENAVRHLPPSGGAVVIGCEVDGESATISVADDGCGIPLDYQARIFDLYSRGPGAGADGGSGVGLAIVKRVVEAHGGRVWVVSEPGRGSVFSVRIGGVLAPGDPTTEPAPRVAEHPSRPGATSPLSDGGGPRA